MSNENLCIMLWNVENLFLYLDHFQDQDLGRLSERAWQKLSNATTPNKPLNKLWGLQQAITEVDPDILMLNEVGGLESIENFNSIFLQSKYKARLIEGNSDRGIDVGYLIKADLADSCEITSHKNKPIQLQHPSQQKDTPYFLSRDIAQLSLKDDKSKARAIFFLTHLKSKLDPENIDKEGIRRRTAEAQLMTDLYLQTEKQNPDTPIFVCGDFNGILSDPGHSEFQSLRDKTELVDSMNFSQHCSEEDRVTQLQFRFGRRFHYQFDYILVHPKFSGMIVQDKSYIYYLKTKEGVNRPLPSSLEERLRLPSDHYPVVVTLELP